jgi:hypothetical protein
MQTNLFQSIFIQNIFENGLVALICRLITYRNTDTLTCFPDDLFISCRFIKSFSFCILFAVCLCISLPVCV